MLLAGQNVLVVGSHALGLSIARGLAAAGVRGVLHCDAPDGSTMDHDAASIDVLSDPIGTVEQAEALVTKCWGSFGPLAGRVLVPAEASPDRFADDDNDWQLAMRSALKIPFFLARSVAARMEKTGGGCIVNVVGSEPRGTPLSLAVNEVTRAASITMTRALAKALPSQVRVCAVVGSSVTAHEDASGFGSDVAQTVLFLLSGESLGTGVVVHLDEN
jgi:NAD(P)-dependent dehydrogenase (short-subunit alcohol dehydrogenase family)